MAGEYILSVILKAQNKANPDITSFVSKMEGMKPAALGVVGAFAIVGAAVAGFTALSVKKAMDYQTAMTQLKNTTGSTQAQMAGYAQTIRRVSDDTGVAQTELAKGMYQVISANFAGADASRILTTATQAATIAGANQATVTTGLVVSLNAFGLKASQVDTVSNQMFKTLALGRGNMSDLAGALQTGGALVHHYGVSYTDLSATLATLSTGGMKTFGTAMTGVTQLLNVMDGKTDMMTKRIHKLGIPFDEARFKTMSYQQQVAYLNQTLEHNKGQTVAILGSKQAATALGILGTQTNLLRANTRALSNSQELAKEKAQAWADKQKDTAQQMQKLQTNISNLMIDLGSKLLPVINKLISVVGPLVSKFVDWLTKSGILQGAIDGLSKAITWIVDKVTQFSNFLNHNAAAMTAFKIVAIAMAGVLGGLLVAALVTLAVAAWAAVAPFLVFALPFIAVGAAIALVIAGIVLAVQHWGEITKWFQGLWSSVSSWFMGLLRSIGSFFTGLWNGIANFFKGVWDHITGFLKGAWQVILNIIKIGGMILLGLFLGPFIAIGAAFIWLYNHNRYVKQLVDAIVKFFEACIAWVKNAWNTAIAWLAALWNGIKDIATKAWNAVSSAVMGVVNKVVAWLKGLWDTEVRGLGIIWNKLKDLATTAWNAVVGVFKSVWTPISGALKGLWTNISGWFGNLATQALTWGKNLIQGFLDGITGMLGNVGNTVSKVASKVAAFLGFHSPAKEGPGSDAHMWAPNLMAMYAGGIQGGLPGIKVAVSNAAQLMRDGFVTQANALFREINAAQAALVDTKGDASYQKWLDARSKAYDKYLHAHHGKHAKPFHFRSYKPGVNHGLSLGAFANQTSFFDTELGNGTPVAPFGDHRQVNHTTVIQISANDAADVAAKVKAIQDKQYRMSGQITPMSSGGKLK